MSFLGKVAKIMIIWKMSETPVFAKKYALGKFDAKAFFEVWSTAFYVIFREESEF